MEKQQRIFVYCLAVCHCHNIRTSSVAKICFMANNVAGNNKTYLGLMQIALYHHHQHVPEGLGVFPVP